MMSKSKIINLLLVCSGVFFLFMLGCEGDRREQVQFSRSSLGKAGFDECFDACEKVMRNQFGRVESNREVSMIEAQPQYFEEKTAVSLDMQSFRRVAKIQLKHRSSQWWAYIQVQVERLDTTTYQQFQSLRSGSDHPAASPMETGETAPLSRKVKWSKVRRERQMEQEILALIRQELGFYTRETTE
jgi:hypothetical protein